MEIKEDISSWGRYMGHSIAQVYVTGGFEVNLVDLNKDILDHSLNSIKSNLKL